MNDTELFSQVTKELARTLHCDELLITRSTCAADIGSWNSLNNVKLLINLERRFKIRFTGVEAASLQNVGELADLISRKAAANLG